MRKWRSARLRRLYGTPQDQLEDNAAVEVVKKEKKEPAAAPPPPKRVKREKTRPESEYNLVCDMPVTFAEPNYNLLVNPLSEQKSKVASYAVNSSRLNIVNGTMLEPCWTRKPKSPEFEHLAAPQIRDKMTNLHDCLLTFGPHTLNVKLVTVRDDLVHLDEEEEKVIKRELHPDLDKKEAEKDKNGPQDGTKDETKDVKSEPSSSAKPVNESERGNGGNNSASNLAIDKPNSAAITPNSNSEEPKEPEKSKDFQISEDKNGDSAKSDTDPDQAKDSKEPKEPEETESKSADEPEKDTTVENSNSEPKSPTSTQQEQSKQDLTPHEPEDSNSSSSTPNEPVNESEVPHSPKPPSTSDPVEVKEELAETASSPPGASQSSAAEPESQSESQPEPVKRKRGRPKKIKTDSEEPEPKSEPKRRGRKPGPGITIDPNISKHVGKRASRLKFEEEEILRKNKKQAEKVENAKKLEAKHKNDEKEAKDANKGSSSDKPGEKSSGNSTNTQESPNKQPPTQPQSQSQPQPQQPQPQPQQPQQPAPNQLVVHKLQQMAAKNPELGVLMKNVASGTASPEDIHAFQTIITRVKTEVMNLQKPKYKPVPILPPKYTSRAIMLALEFEENPNDRFLLPKHSILEYLEKTREVLWSFIVINDTYYTPVTFKFSGIPLGVFEIMAKCVRPKEIVHYKMQKNMQQFKRSEYMNIWFQIEKQDEILIDLIRKISPPTYQVPAQIVKRQVRRRPRLPQIEQTAGPVAGTNPQTKQPAVYKPQPAVSKSRMHLPLETRPTYVQRVGEPMIQVPSYVRTQFRPQLNLPDPRKLNLPRDLPPLPPSMRHLQQ